MGREGEESRNSRPNKRKHCTSVLSISSTLSYLAETTEGYLHSLIYVLSMHSNAPFTFIQFNVHTPWLSTHLGFFVFFCFGIISIALSAAKQLKTNWNPDFEQLKRNGTIWKLPLNTLVNILNSATVFVSIYATPTPLLNILLFLAAFGICVGGAEDYYKRLSTSSPNDFLLNICSLVLFSCVSSVNLFLLLRIMSRTANAIIDDANIRILVPAIAIITLLYASFFLFATYLFLVASAVRTLLLRIALCASAVSVPACVVLFLAVCNSKFSGALYWVLVSTVYMAYPMLLLSQLLTISLLSAQRMSQAVSSKNEPRIEQQEPNSV
eukprot:gb/GEZJ01003635.1/.p1 GENE.gb/GEZJ01003635.1/~~gb/GEZJ01003635.1/.p1  ORF type:complete len:325 (-),score=19.03 gb/GEZJ01003635.1/:959-1933(-)